MIRNLKWVLVAVCLSPPLEAELAWEQTTVAVEAQFGQKEATAVFKFTNRGNTPVRIKEVHADCGCTAAKPARAVFAPGESGELPATMTLNGANRFVSIQVTTDEDTALSYPLVFQVIQIEPVQLTPKLLVWKIGEAPIAKRMTIKLRPGSKFLGAEVQGGTFFNKVESGVSDEVTVWVTPEGTGAKAQATLKLTAAQGDLRVEAKGFLRVL